MHYRCSPGMHWVEGRCVPMGTECPTGSYYNSFSCIPYTACEDGRMWNAQLAQCICPSNSFWNGTMCHICGHGQVYGGHRGCYCPDGTFYDGVRCVTISENKCSSIDYTHWNNNQCLCRSGYRSVDMNCYCDGI